MARSTRRCSASLVALVGHPDRGRRGLPGRLGARGSARASRRWPRSSSSAWRSARTPRPLRGLGRWPAPRASWCSRRSAPRPARTARLRLLLVVGSCSPPPRDLGRGVEGEPLRPSPPVFGAVYAGALLGFGLFLRHLPLHASAWHGPALVLAPVLLTWASDTFAYFAGRAWGTTQADPAGEPREDGRRARSAPWWGACWWRWATPGARPLPERTNRPRWRPPLRVLLSVAAQVGDLVESLFKRDAGVKDSGHPLPRARRRARPLRLAPLHPPAHLPLLPLRGGRRGGDDEGRRDPGRHRLHRKRARWRFSRSTRTASGGGADRPPERGRAAALATRWRPELAVLVDGGCPRGRGADALGAAGRRR
jgi:hypothetical protein